MIDKSTKAQKEDKKREMIEALEKSLNVVTQACQNAGISRRTHYRWMEEDEEYKQTVKEMNDVCLDFAENQLFKRMKEGSDAAIIFFLKTKGKKRGYIERQEIVASKEEINIEEIKASDLKL